MKRPEVVRGGGATAADTGEDGAAAIHGDASIEARWVIDRGDAGTHSDANNMARDSPEREIEELRWQPDLEKTTRYDGFAARLDVGVEGKHSWDAGT